MQRERQIKNLSIIALIVSVIGLGIAFAAVSTTLNIKGTAPLDSSKWDIHFENLSDAKLTGKANVTQVPELTATKIGEYKVVLTGPGDSVTYTFDITNEGTLDARIGTYAKAIPIFTGTDINTANSDEEIYKNSFIYKLYYTDTKKEISEGDTLIAGETKNLTLYIGYNVESTKLPTAKVDVTGLDITIVYIQDI